MLKRRGTLLMVLSLLLALGAAWVARGWVTRRLAAPSAQRQMPVVVAAASIPFGVTVDTRYLQVIDLPAGTPIAAHFSDPKQVVGLVALQQVPRGEFLLPSQFAKHPTGSMLAALLSPGMRAVTVRVNDVVGVAGFVLPGNYVDVVEARMQNQRAITKTVLQDLRVLAVDQTDSHDKSQPQVVRAVTLEVTPKQADVLVKAMTEGHIELALRGTHSAGSVQPVLTRTPVKRKIRHLPQPTHVTLRAPRPLGITIIRGTHIQLARATIRNTRATRDR